MDEQKIAKLKAMLELLDEGVTKKEFIASLQNIISLVTKINEKTNKTVSDIENTYQDLLIKVRDEHTSSLEYLKKQVSDKLSSIMDGKDGKDGLDGKDAEEIDKAEIAGMVCNMIEIPEIEELTNELPKLGTQIRDGLELLVGEERLDVSAIKGLEDIKGKEIRVVGGARGVQLYVDGAKKGLVNTLNLIPGAGVTLSYNRSNGRNDITISAAGGALSVLTATGAVDDSNTVFTFVSTPTLVIVNGATYREGHGVAIVGTTATLDNPVGVGNDLYGLG